MPKSGMDRLAKALVATAILFLHSFRQTAAEEDQSTNAGTQQQQNVSDFDVIDTNVDSLISYGEFQRWHKAVMGAEPKTSAALFGTHDRDLDGKLTVAEFVPLAFELSQKPEKEADKVFKKFDTNSDGLLSEEELKGQAVEGEIVSGLFQVADTNGDQRISYTEFQRVADSFGESHISQDARNAGLAQSIMGALDADKDGRIAEQELFDYASRYGGESTTRQEADRALLELDTDRDRHISLDELKRLPEAVMRAAGIRPIPE